MNEKHLSRRDFLRLAAIGAGAVAVSGGNIFAQEMLTNNTLRLNPAFRIKEISDNEIELFTQTGEGKILKHRFTGLDADLFREIAKENPVEPLISVFSQKHKLSTEVCRQKVNQSLKEFESSKLIYYGDRMLVKISEVKMECQTNTK